MSEFKIYWWRIATVFLISWLGALCIHCAPPYPAGLTSPGLTPACTDLAGVDPRTRVAPVWIANPITGARSPTYVLSGVRIVETNEVVRTPPLQRCVYRAGP